MQDVFRENSKYFNRLADGRFTIYYEFVKSNAGRKPYDVILMFKILILQSLYNLAYDSLEMQILDKLVINREATIC